MYRNAHRSKASKPHTVGSPSSTGAGNPIISEEVAMQQLDDTWNYSHYINKAIRLTRMDKMIKQKMSRQRYFFTHTPWLTHNTNNPCKIPQFARPCSSIFCRSNVACHAINRSSVSVWHLRLHPRDNFIKCEWLDNFKLSICCRSVRSTHLDLHKDNLWRLKI